MEILIKKISEAHDETIYYNGVVAYGKAIDGNTYVLTTQAEAEIVFKNKKYVGKEVLELSETYSINDNNIDTLNIQVDNWFIVCKANQTEITEIFRIDDEMGDGLLFDSYDEGIEGFKNFLERECLIKLTTVNSNDF